MSIIILWVLIFTAIAVGWPSMHTDANDDGIIPDCGKGDIGTIAFSTGFRQLSITDSN
jgi:hypothetical protein